MGEMYLDMLRNVYNMHLFCFSEEGQKQLARVLFQGTSYDLLDDLQKEMLRDRTDELLRNVANVDEAMFPKCKDLAGPLWLYRLRTKLIPRELRGKDLTKEEIEQLPPNWREAFAAFRGPVQKWSEFTRLKVAASTAEKKSFPNIYAVLGTNYYLSRLTTKMS